jgi:1-carboxybiuret hydrolase subunit AtzG-like protein
MASRRKPRRKTKAPVNRKPAAPKSRQAPPADPLDGFIDAAARMLALPVEPQWRAAIRANLEVNLRMANFVAEFALPDETEPAPIFTA